MLSIPNRYRVSISNKTNLPLSQSKTGGVISPSDWYRSIFLILEVFQDYVT